MIENDLADFCEKLKHQSIRRTQLYDGYNQSTGTDADLFKLTTMITEELGEVSSHVIRERYEAAKAECIDIAHCVFLLYVALNNKN